MPKKQELTVVSDAEGEALIALARQSIKAKLGQAVDPRQLDAAHAALKDKQVQAHRGTFVTLTIGGQLRGCIGNLTASDPIPDAIRKNAVSAAFHDYRFTPLTTEELDQVEIEVSILTTPKPLSYTNAQDLISKLRAHVDGVILGKGSAAATFLPQVWDQLPRPENFLSHLCQKAGLPSDAWQDMPLDVSTYQVQSFEERK